MTFPFYSLACLLTLLPSQPQIKFEDSFIQLFPIDLTKCPTADFSKYITFEIFTRHNPLVSQRLRIGDDKLLSESHIDFSIPTVIYFHAFFEDFETTSGTLVRSAYMLRGDHNFIMVSARELYAGPWYPTAARNTYNVGTFAAKFINYLYKRGLRPELLHFVGHSLGAQAAGVAGGALKQRPARITGLDAALPLFAKLPLHMKLDKSDAEFVDVIHTDAGIFGQTVPIGHVDFYVNGGKSPQPGCKIKEVLPQMELFILAFCSHWRSFQFYAESVIRPHAYPSIPCDPSRPICDKPDYRAARYAEPVFMGFGLSPRTRGKFYVKTTAVSPYIYKGYS